MVAGIEDTPPGDDFLAQVCVAWEREAQAADTAYSSDSIAEFYITRVNWLVTQGREDLIGAIAGEYELRLRHGLDQPGRRSCVRSRPTRAADLVG